MEQEQESTSSLFEMEIDMISQDHLKSVASWGKFISVAGFVVMSLAILLMVLGGRKIYDSLYDLMGGGNAFFGLIVAILLVTLAIYAAWFYFLFRASSLLNKALLTRSTKDLSAGFIAMRNFFTISIILSALSIISTVSTLIRI